MIVDLTVPFVDTSISGLRFLPSAPAMPVLGELRQGDLVPGGRLSLRLLGASHQAVLALPDGEYAETLACLDGTEGYGAGLPATRTATVGPWRCRLRIGTDRTSPETLASACRALRRCAEHDDPHHSLYASFPGHPLAATFLQVRPARRHPAGRWLAPAWRTVHVYPESGEQVRTRTEVHPVRSPRASHPDNENARPRRRWEKV